MATDLDLMNKNLRAIDGGSLAFRVSAEHYAWLVGHRCTLLAVAKAAGGFVDGYPTSEINVLQRIRALTDKGPE
jgi:hypothetical protein